MKPAQSITATILGCGSSGGVPRVGNNWGDCDPDEPRNRRLRCSLLLTGKTEGSDGTTQIVIDTGCDFREQMLRAKVNHVDAVFYTHEHADHTHGIDDLRAFALSSHKRVDVHFDSRTAERLNAAFGYCFSAPANSPYPPTLNAHTIEADVPVTIEGDGGAITVLPMLQQHGSIMSLGYKIENFLYSCDVSGFPDASLHHLNNLDFWVIDALRPVPHPSHLSLPEAIQWIERVKPAKAGLTNLHVDMDYADVASKTPSNVEPVYDGFLIEVVSG